MRSFLLPLVLLSTPLTAQTALLEEGDSVPGVGLVTRIDNLTINDAGEWLIEVDTDNANIDADGALVANTGLLLTEGQTLAAPAGATLDSFDAVTLNSAGQSLWNFFLDGTSGGSDDSGIYLGTTLLFQESDATAVPTLSPGTPYIGFLETKINDTGTGLVLASVDDPAITTSVDRVLVRLDLDLGTETAVATEGDLLPGQVEPLDDLLTNPHSFDLNDLGDVMFVANLAGDTSVDHAVYLNDELLAQEGSPSPVAGRNWSTLGSVKVKVNGNRDWALSGSLDGDTASNSLIVRNGVAFRQEGDTLPAISPSVFTSFGSGPVALASSGELLWYGDWDAADTDVDTGLFVDNELIVQEGVTTVGGLLIDTLRGIQDGYTISPNGRWVLFEAILEDGTEGAYLIDRGQRGWQEMRNGAGVNPVALRGLNRPAIGTTWTAEVDSSVFPGAGITALFGYGGPGDGIFLASGEVLIAPASPQFFLRTTGSSGGLDTFDFALPNDVNLLGTPAFLQALLLGGGSSQFTSALDVTAGN